MFFTPKELKIIHDKVQVLKSTDEMSMLIYLLLKTNLKVCDLLGWFNHNVPKRTLYLDTNDLHILEDYESIPTLFPKKHQTYLLQWKAACVKWIGKTHVTFEMIRKSKQPLKKKEKISKKLKFSDFSAYDIKNDELEANEPK